MSSLLIQHRKIVAPLLMFGAIAFALLLEAPANDFYPHWAKILAAPLGILFFLFTYRHYRDIKKLTLDKPWVIWTTAVGMYALALLLLPMYVLALNATIVREETLVFSGPVIKKYKFSKKPGYIIRISDTKTGEPIDLGVSSTEFGRIQIGVEYRICFYRGLLAIPFKWRYGENSGLCTLSRAI